MTGKHGEDFTGWVEVDPMTGEPGVPAYGRLRQFAWNETADKASKSEWVNLNRLDPATYLYKDYGASYFDDFVHDFELEVNDMTYGTSSKERLNAIAYSNAVGSWEGVKTGANVAIAVRVRASVTEDYYYIRLVEWDGSNEYITAAPGTSEWMYLDSKIYCRLTKNGTSLRLDLYENSARNITLDNPYSEPIYYELTLQADHEFRYILAPQGMGLVDGARRSSSGDIQRLVLDAPTGTGSGDLFCDFDLKHAGTADLKAEVRLRQETNDLFAEFLLRQGEYDLFAKTLIQNKGTKDLYAKFEIQDSEDLKAILLLRQLTYDLYCKFFVSDYVEPLDIDSEFLTYSEATSSQVIEIDSHYEVLGTVETYADLKAVFVVGGYEDLFSKVTVRHTGTADLKGIFDVSNHEDLFAKFSVDQTSAGVTLPLSTEIFTWDVGDEVLTLEITSTYDIDDDALDVETIDILSHYEILGTVETYADLKAVFIVGGFEDLYANLTVRHTAAEDLKAVFDVSTHRDLFAKFSVDQSSVGVTLPLSTEIFTWNTDGDEVLTLEITSTYATDDDALDVETIDILSHYEILGTVETYADLKAVFVVGGYEDLFSKVTVRHTGTADLKGVFDVSTHRDLFAKFSVDQSSVGVTLPLSTEIFTWNTDGDESLPLEITSGYIITGTLESYWELKAEFRLRQETNDLFAEFYVQVPFEDLFAKFEVRQATKDLFAELVVQHTATGDLFAEFELQLVSDLFAKFEITPSEQTLDLFSEFIVRHPATQDLFSEFVVQQIATKDLFAKFIVQQSGSQDLFAKFEAQATVDLFAEFIIQQTGTQELFAEVIVRHTVTEDLFSELIVRHTATADLFSEFVVQHTDIADLFAKLIVQQTATQDLFAEFVVQTPNAEDLFAEFVVRHTATADLFSELTVQHTSVADLLAEFVVRQTGAADLFSEFIVQHTATKDLFAEFVVQLTGIRDIKAEFIVRHTEQKDLYAKTTIRNIDVEDLFSEFTVRHSATNDLKAVLEVGQGSQDLFAELVVRHFLFPSDLFAEFTVRHSQARELAAEFVTRHSASSDLFSEFTVRHSAAEDLGAEFTVFNSGYADISAKIVVRHTAVRDLAAELIIRHGDYFDIPAEFVLRHERAEDLKAILVVRNESYSVLYAKFVLRQLTGDLQAEFTVRNYGTRELYSILYIRHPTWQWTNKRYIEGVISDIPVSDAILEYVIEGVMVDIQGYLVSNDLSYDWVDILEVPILIKRATTYGTVATLYARGYFDDRIMVTIPPRTLTVLSEDRDGGMDYWEAKMEAMLGLYSSSTSSTVLWVDTWGEEAVFSMEEIPLQSEDIYKEYK